MNKTKRRAHKRSLKTSPVKKKKPQVEPGYFLNEYGFPQPIDTRYRPRPYTGGFLGSMRRRASRRPPELLF